MNTLRFIPRVEEIESRFTPAASATNPAAMTGDASTPALVGATTDMNQPSGTAATGSGGTGPQFGATPAPPTSTTGNRSDGTSATGTSGSAGSTSAGASGSGATATPFFSSSSGSAGGFGGGLFVVNTLGVTPISTGVPNGSTPNGGIVGTPAPSLGDTNGRTGTIDNGAATARPATNSFVTDTSTQSTTTGAIGGSGGSTAGAATTGGGGSSAA